MAQKVPFSCLLYRAEHIIRVGEVARLQEHRGLFLTFPEPVCPEPVLVKSSITLSQSGPQNGFSRKLTVGTRNATSDCGVGGRTKNGTQSCQRLPCLSSTPYTPVGRPSVGTRSDSDQPASPTCSGEY